MSVVAPIAQPQEASVWYGPLPEDRIMRLQPACGLAPPAVHAQRVLTQTPQKVSKPTPRHLPQQAGPSSTSKFRKSVDRVILADRDVSSFKKDKQLEDDNVLSQLAQPYRSAACLQATHFPIQTASQAHVPLGPLVAAKLPELSATVPMEEGAIGPMVTEQAPLQSWTPTLKTLVPLDDKQSGPVLALLENLEARVSLMSQMQETRQAIQCRAYAIEALQVADDGSGAHHMEEGSWTAAESEASMAVPAPACIAANPAYGYANVAPKTADSHVGDAVLGDASSSGDYFQHPAIYAEKNPWPFPHTACVPPFHPVAHGANLAFSDGGYLAKRAQGCRQAVAVGSTPLQAQDCGWYFEVEIKEVVDGWIGGLGIGFTGTPPDDLRRVPDKAWRLPRSVVIGYWGCVFLHGEERGTTWRADGLLEGSRVGVLATNEGRGDLIVFVDRKPVARVAGALLGNGNNDVSKDVNSGEGSANSVVPLWRLPLFPVVDVFAATRVVAMLREATPPPPPWQIEVDTSRSGSL